VASDAAVTAAWQRYGYDVTDLPLAGVDERLAFVRRLLQPDAA
jgi:predicted ATPase